MAVIQAMDGDQYKKFDDLAHAYLNRLFQCFSLASTVVEVFDRYDNPESVKQGERERRQDHLEGSTRLSEADQFHLGGSSLTL